MLRFERFLLADEQSLIPRSLVFADRTYKHGDFLRHRPPRRSRRTAPPKQNSRATAFGATRTLRETPRARRVPHPGCRLHVAQRSVQSLCTYGAQRSPLGAQERFLADLSLSLLWSTVFAAGNDRLAVRNGITCSSASSVVAADVQRSRSSTTSTPP
jgi:hypothetical protein